MRTPTAQATAARPTAGGGGGGRCRLIVPTYALYSRTRLSCAVKFSHDKTPGMSLLSMHCIPGWIGFRSARAGLLVSRFVCSERHGGHVCVRPSWLKCNCERLRTRTRATWPLGRRGWVLRKSEPGFGPRAARARGERSNGVLTGG